MTPPTVLRRRPPPDCLDLPHLREHLPAAHRELSADLWGRVLGHLGDGSVACFRLAGRESNRIVLACPRLAYHRRWLRWSLREHGPDVTLPRALERRVAQSVERLDLLGADVGPTSLACLQRMARLTSLGMSMPAAPWPAYRAARLHSVTTLTLAAPSAAAACPSPPVQLCQLPELERLALSGVHYDATIGDGLATLTALTRLTRLSLYRSSISQRCTATLARLPLRRLDWLGCATVHETTVRALVQVPHLCELHLSVEHLGHGALDAIAQLRSLRDVHIEVHTAVPGVGLQPLTALARLRRLELTRSMLDDAGQGNVGRLTGLTSLGLRRSLRRRADLWFLHEMRQLRRLDLSGNTIRNLRGLACLARVEELSLAGCGLDDAALLPLGSLHRLAVLDLTGNHLGHLAGGVLAGLAHLETLSLANCPFSPSLLSGLASATRLRTLSLEGVALTTSPGIGVQALWPLHALQTLRLAHADLHVDDIRHIQGLGRLTSLDLSHTILSPGRPMRLRGERWLLEFQVALRRTSQLFGVEG